VAWTLVAGLGQFRTLDPYFCFKFTYLNRNK